MVVEVLPSREVTLKGKVEAFQFMGKESVNPIISWLTEHGSGFRVTSLKGSVTLVLLDSRNSTNDISVAHGWWIVIYATDGKPVAQVLDNETFRSIFKRVADDANISS